MQIISYLIKLMLYLGLPQWWKAIDAERRRWTVGILLIVSVSIIWVVASFVVQEVESQGLHPFLLSYIANSLFIVYLPLHWIASGTHKAPQERRATEDVEEDASEASHLQRSSSLPKSDQLGNEFQTYQPQSSRTWGVFQDSKTLRAALVVAPLWFLAQFTFNLSLHMTSVTSNTILSSTSSLFTYAMSCAFSLERLALRKLIFILLCVAGAGIVGYTDERNGADQGSNSVSGDILCVLSACFYAAYTIAIRLMLEDDKSAKMMLFFGFVGLLNLLCLAPVLLGLWLASIVHVEQLTAKMFGLTVAKGLFDNALSDYLWARAVLLIGPTIATLGLSLQFPIAAVSDVALKSPPWLHNSTWIYMLLGALAILTGFFGINVDSWDWLMPSRQNGR